MTETFDAVVVGGGPCGATAADELARHGRSVLLLDKAGRIKPCGGAIPPRLIRDFGIPAHLLTARITAARVIAPSTRAVDMPIDGGFVGMVDRDVFDEWLRDRAASDGAVRRTARFGKISRDTDGTTVVHYQMKDGSAASARTRVVIGADGAKSGVAAQSIPGADKVPHVFAYHEIIRTPARGIDGTRCDIYYQGQVSPDFYGWIFPHGETTSIGSGSMRKGFSLRQSVTRLRDIAGLKDADTVRREGAPIPLRPMRRWDNGRDVLVAGDAAGVVAPASGEGIYYAMEGGRLAAEAADAFLATGDARALRTARKRFMKAHGRVFWILRMMQHFWYASDRRREQFVSICKDPDVQRMTWDSYMNKQLTRARPASHVRIFLKDMAHLLGLASA
ncbi:MAG TPA: geranylgeranyl diphosphate reductase [Rhodopila sp.]|nr:geranylgeranyl diphosphate reductase [Rhodopila sp.]